MAAIVTDLAPSSLAMAVKANLYAFFQSLRASSQANVYDTAHLLLAHARRPPMVQRRSQRAASSSCGSHC